MLLGASLKERYQIEAELGRGGMAVVYRARDAVLQRDVAVKVLHSHLADRKVARQRLRREALAVAKLSQDNILKVYDFSGEDENGPAFLVTEYVRGSTLRALLDEHKDLPCEVAAMMGVVLAEALSHAHKAGIIHRDIKPENVMYRADDGQLKLMDFGIAKLFEEKELTLTGGLLGSPAHMAPEVIEGKNADARSDLFSLGTLLYLFATGEYPFWAQNPHALLRQISQGKFKDPENVRAAVGRKLSGIIKKSMALDPAARYQDADAMAKALRAFLAELGIDEPYSALSAFLRDIEGESPRLQDKVVAALLLRAREALKQGRKGEVLAHLNRVLGYDPENAPATELLASLHKSNRLWYAAGGVGALLALGGLGWGIFLLIQPPVASQPTTLSMVPYSFAPSLPVDPTSNTQPTTKESATPVPPDTSPTSLVATPATIPANPKNNPTTIKANTPETRPVAEIQSDKAYPLRFRAYPYAVLSINKAKKGVINQAGKTFMLAPSKEPYMILFDHPNYFPRECALYVTAGGGDKPALKMCNNQYDELPVINFEKEDRFQDAVVAVTVSPPEGKDMEVRCVETSGEPCGRFSGASGNISLSMKGLNREVGIFLVRDGKDSPTQVVRVTAGAENKGLQFSFGGEP